MTFHVSESFAHGMSLEKAVEALARGVKDLQANYPQYIDPNAVFTDEGTTVNVMGHHFRIKVRVNDAMVLVTGTEDLAGHLAHGKVSDLIHGIFKA